MNDFTENVFDELVRNKVSVNSAKQYITFLRRINGSKDYKDLDFLNDFGEIMKYLDKYSKNTKLTYLSGIVKITSLFPKKKEIHAKYKAKLKELLEEKKKVNPNIKTEKEKNNWVNWDEIVDVRNKLKTEIDNQSKSSVMLEKGWKQQMQYLLLNLFTRFPPRRNADYHYMRIVKETPKGFVMDKNRNYYFVDRNKMIFNNYKTAKTHGPQVYSLDNKPKLVSVLKNYIKIHPLTANNEFNMLVSDTGKTMESTNAITRLLNSVVKKYLGKDKNVGSTMLRHSYITDKYKKVDKDREEEAAAMGHTVAMSRQYVKL